MKTPYWGIIGLSATSGFVGAIVTNLLLPSLTVIAQPVQEHVKVLEAEEFRLVDSDGTVRGRFFANAQSYERGLQKRRIPSVFDGGLELYGGGERGSAVQLWVDDKDAGLRLYDERTKARANVLLWNGDSSVELLDKNRSRIEALVDRSGNSSIDLYDTDGNHRAALGHASTEVVRTGIAMEHPESTLILLNKDGKVLWSAP